MLVLTYGEKYDMIHSRYRVFNDNISTATLIFYFGAKFQNIECCISKYRAVLYRGCVR
jgi:hypothetical protein